MRGVRKSLYGRILGGGAIFKDRDVADSRRAVKTEWQRYNLLLYGGRFHIIVVVLRQHKQSLLTLWFPNKIQRTKLGDASLAPSYFHRGASKGTSTSNHEIRYH